MNIFRDFFMTNNEIALEVPTEDLLQPTSMIYVGEDFASAQEVISVDGIVPGQKECKALWDTGSGHTIISNKLARSLNLEWYVKSGQNTSNGERQTTMYYISLTFPTGKVIPRLLVADFEDVSDDSKENIKLLIGMDLISISDFKITCRNGYSQFTACFPSMSFGNKIPEIPKMKIPEMG